MARVAIVGAGAMGASIAQLATRHGHQVCLVDTEADARERAKVKIQKSLQRQQQRGRIDADAVTGAMQRLSLRPSLDTGAQDLIIEAVPEDLTLKQDLLAHVEPRLAKDGVLATNTSSLSVKAIGQKLRRAQRLVGLHFFNPPTHMPLVELIRTPLSADDALHKARLLVEELGKTAIAVRDAPGFVVNRVARNFYLEALRGFEHGLANVAEIDEAVRDLGWPMGPFELMDLIGVDIGLAVSESLHEAFAQTARFAPSPLQKKMVAEGRLGQKSGRGFYRYDADERTVDVTTTAPSPQTNKRSAVEDQARVKLELTSHSAGVSRVATRIVAAVINEAMMLVREDIASAEDVDRAMQLGTRMPIGPCAWRQKLGEDWVDALLDDLATSAADGRFTTTQT